MPRILFIIPLLIVSCSESGQRSTHTDSSKFATLSERVKVLEKYVTFRRTYETLDFDIQYWDNSSGRLPAPSDWDIRVVATVPESELKAWELVGQSVSPTKQDLDWLKSVPTSLDLSGVKEWKLTGPRLVGFDRARRIVVYRATSVPMSIAPTSQPS